MNNGKGRKVYIYKCRCSHLISYRKLTKIQTCPKCEDRILFLKNSFENSLEFLDNLKGKINGK